MKEIDFETWNRKELYSFFETISNPFYMVSFTVDVTELVAFVKRTGLSFYLSMIWLCSTALNEIENFRYTIRDGEIYLLTKRAPSFTDIEKGSDLFKIVTLALEDDLHVFNAAARKKSAEQKVFIDSALESDSLIYISCLPTLRMTALTNERDLNDPHCAENNIPNISWGKYVDVNGRKELNISLEVNHRFIDGVHIAAFANKLEEMIKALPQED